MGAARCTAAERVADDGSRLAELRVGGYVLRRSDHDDGSEREFGIDAAVRVQFSGAVAEERGRGRERRKAGVDADADIRGGRATDVPRGEYDRGAASDET